ncbi:MAG: site-2 protease family protein [Candidatus Doudnabacteria bacterium]|nr:site-2 protease family protein [Candidatus Doudnabacteria bacterium]
MDPISVIIFIFILLFSVIFHEVAHGLAADRLGDPTARYSGRLTLNPIPHIDLFGSILLPAFLYFLGLPVLGAAKPVPVNFQNLRNIKRDTILVSLAGPGMNFLLAAIAGMVFRFSPNLSSMGTILILQTVSLNLVLGIFNLIPIPPLDGSKVIASLLGFINEGLMDIFFRFERFGFFLVYLLLIGGVLFRILIPPLLYLFEIFTGIEYRANLF